ncbi:hypothetical protein EJ110_NYTH56002 [Nymphaea thermarum]|nr:hypothetical protein EJ110_NYTH56002 [Nymphaea thermarum]
MAESSSSIVNTNHAEVEASKTENIPIQVTTIRLTKENYLQWSAAITMGIAGRGQIAYVNGRKTKLVETSAAWDTWFLEDNQMYNQKKKTIQVYQLMKDVYVLRQRDLSMADFYAALKSKWEELDYYSDDTWNCPQDQVRRVAKEWESRVFLFLVKPNDDFEGVRSQILNSEEVFCIENVYSRVNAEEQRRLVITGRKGDHTLYNERLALVSYAPMGALQVYSLQENGSYHGILLGPAS